MAINKTKSQFAIGERNAELATHKIKVGLSEKIERQYFRTHKASFAKFLKEKLGYKQTEISKILEYYDKVVIPITSKKHGESNIMKVFPLSMPTFLEHFVNGTLDDLPNNSETIHHGAVSIHLQADPQDIKRNPKVIKPEPPNRKIKYLAEGVRYRDNKFSKEPKAEPVNVKDLIAAEELKQEVESQLT